MASEAEDAAALFQQHREELGFVNVAQCREKSLYTEYDGEEIIGAALGNHCVRKPQTTLYDIAVRESHRRNGIANRLLTRMAGDSPHDQIIAKCPVDLPAVQFYVQSGWQVVDVVDGTNRALTVWRYPIGDE
jgi:GNAT superfamily N-acetyltransferase